MIEEGQLMLSQKVLAYIMNLNESLKIGFNGCKTSGDLARAQSFISKEGAVFNIA